MRRLLLLACGALVACGTPSGVDAGTDAGVTVDSGQPPVAVCLADKPDASVSDAGWDGGYDFSCRGQPLPAGGQAELVISGKTTRAGFTRTLLGDIDLALLSTSGEVLATATSESDGGYTLRADAGCLALAGEVRATSRDGGFAPAYAVPEAPWRYDRSNLELVMFDAPTQGLAAALAAVTLQDGGAALAIAIEDCAGNPVEGALVQVENDAGVVRYVSNGVPSNAQTATGPDGELVIFNLFGTSVRVTASRDGTVFADKVLPVHESAVIGATLTP